MPDTGDEFGEPAVRAAPLRACCGGGGGKRLRWATQGGKGGGLTPIMRLLHGPFQARSRAFTGNASSPTFFVNWNTGSGCTRLCPHVGCSCCKRALGFLSQGEHVTVNVPISALSTRIRLLYINKMFSYMPLRAVLVKATL